jgi:hypothetical protein
MTTGIANMQKLFVLSVTYNEQGPFVAVTRKRAVLSAALFASEGEPLRLLVTAPDGEGVRDYQLEGLRPGDQLCLRYDVCADDRASSIERLPSSAHPGETPWVPAEGQRAGLEVTDIGDKEYVRKRLDRRHDEDLQRMFGPLPLDHVRVVVMAAKEPERWSWRLPDLYSGDAIAIKVMRPTGAIRSPS